MRQAVLVCICILGILVLIQRTGADEEGPYVETRLLNTSIRIKREIDYTADPIRIRDINRMTLNMSICSKESLILRAIRENGRVVSVEAKAVTDTGEDLECFGATFSGHRNVSLPMERESDGHFLLGKLLLHMESPTDEARSLTQVSGKMDALCMETFDEFVVEDPASKIGQTFNAPFADFTIDKVLEEGKLSFTFKMNPDWTGNKNQVVFRANAKKDAGIQTACFRSWQTTGEELHHVAGFSDPISSTGRLVIRYPRKVTKVRIPLLFKDVPLTDDLEE